MPLSDILQAEEGWILATSSLGAERESESPKERFTSLVSDQSTIKLSKIERNVSSVLEKITNFVSYIFCVSSVLT